MCTNVFINKNQYKIEARSMDFPINIAFKNGWGYVGIENVTDVVIDADKIPESRIAKWTSKYGYFCRLGFESYVTDGLNTQGFSYSILYLDGTVYPSYDDNDNKPALAVYELGNFLLAMAKDVADALELISEYQIVNSAVKLKDGIYIKNIPLHMCLRDANGNSAVIEFIGGKMYIHKNAGNVLTNAPTYEWHLSNIEEYKSLLQPLVNNNNPKFSDRVINYADTISSSRPEVAQLVGLPGDFSAAARFVRSYILSELMLEPKSNREAIFHAASIIANASVPPYEKSMTLWTTIKDLKNLTVAYKDNAVYQGTGPVGVYAMNIDNGYVTYDLNAMNFYDIPPAEQDSGLKLTSPNEIKQIIDMSAVVGLERQ